MLHFFKTCLPILHNLEVIGSKNVMSTKCWLLAIACLTQLWDHLQPEHNLSYLFTSRLNQDIVEHLFATVRRKGGCRDNPNAKEFRCAPRMVMVADLIKPVIGTNCAPDTDKFITTLKSIGKPQQLGLHSPSCQ